MKVLVIGFTKLAYMPYFNIHLDVLRQAGAKIHLLYWNRDGKKDIEAPQDITLHEFRLIQKDEERGCIKAFNFLKFRARALPLLKSGEFDKVVVLSTIPAVILADQLIGRYRNRFIFDYRDVTFDSLRLYNRAVHAVARASLLTVYSSPGYARFLPQDCRCHVVHNLLFDSLEKRELRKAKDRGQHPIRIRYWGLIRHEHANRRLIELVGNDPRFVLHYHGRMESMALFLQKHCADHNIGNVFFHGTYLPEERYKFIEETDLIHNVYDNDFKTQPAMGNKYYDGIIHYLPQVCNLGSQMGDMVEQKGVGVAVDLKHNDLGDVLASYYRNMTWPTFNNNCDNSTEGVLNEYEGCKKALLDALHR